MTHPNIDQPADQQTTMLTILLQNDPRCYRGFGWLWWPVKAALKTRVTQRELPILGEHQEPEMIRLALETYGDVQGILDAAYDHYAQRAYLGQLLAVDDHLPDGAAYRLNDPDAAEVDALSPA